MNTYKTSTGERLKKSVIDRRIREAKKKKAQKTANHFFCQACGYNVYGEFIDMSHIISVDRCQKLGKAELAFDPDNLQQECRKCHQVWEGAPIKKKMQQVNYERKKSYIERHDPQRYAVMKMAEI